jgi:AcrR family transcriptional regulator
MPGVVDGLFGHDATIPTSRYDIDVTDNRERVVASACQLFWRHGYSTTSPRQIMRASEVGQGSFYHHFPTKADLGRAAIERNAREVVALAESALGGDAPGLQRLHDYLLAQRDALGGCRAGGFTYDAGVMQDPSLRGLLAGAFERIQELVSAAVRDAQRGGSLDPDLDPADLAATVVGVVQGGYVTARATGDPAALQRAVRGAAALLRVHT